MRCIAKKIAVMVVFLLFCMTFLSFSAQEVRAVDFSGGAGGSIFNALHTVFGFLDVVSLEKIGIEDQSTFAAKAIIGILIFSLLFFASKSLFGDHKNIGIIVSLAVTLMILIAVPNSILKSLIETYSVVALVILYLVPIVAVAYLHHIAKQKIPGRAGHLALFFLYLLLLYLLSQFKGGILTELTNKGTTYVENIASFTDVLLGIILIMLAIELVKFAKGDGSGSSFSLGGGGGIPNLGASSSGPGFLSRSAKSVKKLWPFESKEEENKHQMENAQKMTEYLENLSNDQMRLEGEIQKKAGAELHDIESIHALISNLYSALDYVKQNQKHIPPENQKAFMIKVNEKIGAILAQLNRYFTDLGKKENDIRSFYNANFKTLEAKKKNLLTGLITRKNKAGADLKNMQKYLDALSDNAKKELNDAIGLQNVLHTQMTELHALLDNELAVGNQAQTAVQSAHLLQMRLTSRLQTLIASLKAGNIDAAETNINEIDTILKQYVQIVEFNKRAEKVLIESEAKEIDLEKQMVILEKRTVDLDIKMRNELNAATRAAQSNPKP